MAKPAILEIKDKGIRKILSVVETINYTFWLVIKMYLYGYGQVVNICLIMFESK